MLFRALFGCSGEKVLNVCCFMVIGKSQYLDHLITDTRFITDDDFHVLVLIMGDKSTSGLERTRLK